MSLTYAVLLCDHDDTRRGWCEQVLRAAGYSVVAVPDGGAWLAATSRGHPDLAIVCADASGVDGRDLVRRLRSHPALVDTVVMLVAPETATAAHRSDALDAGADAYLTRPLDPNELVGWVRTSLRRQVTLDFLRASESRLRAIVDTEPECVKVVSLDGRLLDMNQAGLRMIQAVDAAQVFGRLVTDLVHPDDRAAFLAHHHEVAQGRARRLQFRIVGLEGRMRWMDTHAVALRAPDGSITSVLSVTHDMTERKQAEDQLRDSEARFRELAENLRDVFYTYDPVSGRTLYVSPAYETIWQRTRESLYEVPLSFRDAVYPDDLHVVLAAIERQRTGSATDAEYRIVRPDGGVRWIRDHSYPVMNAAGGIERVVGTARDVTDYKLAGDRVREQASLLDKARDAIMVRDLDHRISYWNRGAERLYGWSEEQAIGRSVFDLLQLDSAAFQAAADLTVSAGEWAGELRHTGKDGQEVIVEGRWTLVRDREERPRSILAIETDITARRTLERQFLRAQRLESIGTLAGGIAHDLNNVLTPIMMSIELLKESITDESGQALLTTIGQSASRGAQMVSQVLSFARGVEGRRVNVDPAQLIAEVESIVRETFPKNILLRTGVKPGVWTLAADPTQLHQVLINLCVNARDAMPLGGELTVTAANISLDEPYAARNIDARPGSYVVLGVKDSGSGIPLAALDKIFDPFFTTKEFGKGTGLGLSTSLAIVKGHGGFIRCDSEPGKGTHFDIYLPARTRNAGPGTTTTSLDLPRGHGETILIVDDEPSIRELVRRTAEAFGYRVLEASNGAEAVAVYGHHQSVVDVVLVDVMMPVMDGLSAISALVKMNPAIRIVATSGVTTDASMATTASAGARHFLPKPYTAENLLRILQRALNDATRRRVDLL